MNYWRNKVLPHHGADELSEEQTLDFILRTAAGRRSSMTWFINCGGTCNFILEEEEHFKIRDVHSSRALKWSESAEGAFDLRSNTSTQVSADLTSSAPLHSFQCPVQWFPICGLRRHNGPQNESEVSQEETKQEKKNHISATHWVFVSFILKSWIVWHPDICKN